jgi:hypothetical protein
MLYILWTYFVTTFILTGYVLLICWVAELLLCLLGIRELSRWVLNHHAAVLSLFEVFVSY